LLSQDACFMIAFTSFWLQLALYYPPEDNIVSTYILDENLKQDESKSENSNQTDIEAFQAGQEQYLTSYD